MIVHVITNFSGIGGAEMMLSRLVKETERDNTHVIISLMQISDIYVEALERCDSYRDGSVNLNNSYK